MKLITLTKETNEIQRVLALKSNRQKRYQYKEFVIEGHASIDQAYLHDWEINSLFYNKDIELSQWAKNHLNNQCYKTIYAVSGQLMDKISDKIDSSELIAIVKMKINPFHLYQPKVQDVLIVLDEPNSPGNLGMVIRSATAFGAAAIVISGHAADEYDPKCIRASVGTFFNLPIYRIEGISAFSKIVEPLKPKFNFRFIASGDKGSISIKKACFTADVLFLILGNETSGVSKGYQNMSDEFVQIPFHGKFTSLNIAAAASIFLYEIFNQRESFQSKTGSFLNDSTRTF